MLLIILHTLQVLFGAFAGVLSYSAIVRLQQYESMTRRAAQYSAIAEQQLRKTRTTQASGALSVLLSIGSSLYLSFTVTEKDPIVNLCACFVNCLALIGAYLYIGSFWEGAAKIPGASTYNDAVRSTEKLRTGLFYLFMTWTVTSMFYIWASMD